MVEANWVDGDIHKVIRVTLNLSWHSLIYTSLSTNGYTFSTQEVPALLWLCPSVLKHAFAYMVWNWRTQRNNDQLNTSKHTHARTHILNSMRNVYKLSNTVMLLKLGVLYEKKTSCDIQNHWIFPLFLFFVRIVVSPFVVFWVTALHIRSSTSSNRYVDIFLQNVFPITMLLLPKLNLLF